LDEGLDGVSLRTNNKGRQKQKKRGELRCFACVCGEVFGFRVMIGMGGAVKRAATGAREKRDASEYRTRDVSLHTRYE
jgi:hypothetical protein